MDRLTQILTKQREDWLAAVEQMQAGTLHMYEDRKEITQAWATFLISKIAEIDEPLEARDPQ